MSIKIAFSQDSETNVILSLLKEIDLYYPKVKFKNFWLAKDKNKYVGLVQFTEYPEYFFLSSLGIIKSHRKKGIAALLIDNLLKIANKKKKKTYLYTVIPDFFKKFGFKIINPQDSLPSKDPYECNYCSPEKCICMVKSYSDTPISQI